MSIIEILVLSIALALDALIVSFSYGMMLSSNRMKYAFLLAFSFGFFQFLMPLIGWNLTGFLYSSLENYSKIIVFLVFFLLALKFIFEAFLKDEKEKINCISTFCIVSLAIATSIDALGAGVSIRLLNNNIWLPSISIGIITFILSFVGFFIAGIFNKLSSKYVNILGAILLFYLSLKTLF